MIIGVSGVAGAGKDLFVQACIEQLEQEGKSVGSLAIANLLKLEARDWCVKHYGIDPMLCCRKDKEKIREFLVFHGTMKRKSSNGRHWIDLTNDVVKDAQQIYDYVFISDVRYNDFAKDEVYWVKEELQGKLVHVSQYEMREVLDKRNWPKTKTDKVFLPPANAEEERNDPTLRAEADYVLEWERVKKINKHKYITSEVVKFIEWINSATTTGRKSNR
jgi:hypothetical protein